MSSLNTEASVTEYEDESKDHEEHEDTLGDLTNIQKQTKAMGKLNTSQMNVRSLSLSDTVGAMLYCSSNDISQISDMPSSTFPMTISSEFLKPASRHFKNEEKRQSKNDNNGVAEEEIKVVAAGDNVVEPPAICLGCTEAKFSEQKFSLLCFSWRKRKKGLTYHTCKA